MGRAKPSHLSSPSGSINVPPPTPYLLLGGLVLCHPLRDGGAVAHGQRDSRPPSGVRVLHARLGRGRTHARFRPCTAIAT